MIAPALAVLASATCLASPVHDGKVQAGPFVGYVTAGYDVVRGRFRLHVGPYRVPNALTQKIPWFVPLRYRVGDTLVVTGRRIGASARTFRQTFARAYSPDSPNKHVFPSIIAPPTAGLLAPGVPERPAHRFTHGARLEQLLKGRDRPSGLSLQ